MIYVYDDSIGKCYKFVAIREGFFAAKACIEGILQLGHKCRCDRMGEVLNYT